METGRRGAVRNGAVSLGFLDRGWGGEERSEEGLRCCQAGEGPEKKSNREGLIPSLPLGGAWLHGRRPPAWRNR